MANLAGYVASHGKDPGLPLGALLVSASIRADSWHSKPALLRHESGRAVLTFQVSQAHSASVERVI